MTDDIQYLGLKNEEEHLSVITGNSRHQLEEQANLMLCKYLNILIFYINKYHSTVILLAQHFVFSIKNFKTLSSDCGLK